MIPTGPHGGDGPRLAAALGIPADAVLDLSASLNPIAPDPTPVVARHAVAVRRYPDPGEATAALAGAMGVEADRLLLTNGGAEAIALVASENPCGQVDDPEFSLYRRHLREVRPGAPRWRSNPHNPTGRLAGDAERAGVWDEAFFPLATGTWTRGDADRGSYVVGSLTKLFACPGLRLGYVLCPNGAAARRLAGRQPRWSVNGPALAALPDLLASADLGGWSAAIARLRQEMVSLLRRHGFDPEESDANWVLVRAPGLRDRLARSAILVRDCSTFGMPGTMRIAVPSDEGLERLGEALARLAGSEGRTGGAYLGATARDLAAAPKPRAPGLMVCGTGSDCGKSTLVAGLCRVLARRGLRVAPFKAQNMALNSAVTASGHEIGRAQAAQAVAAGVEAEVAMNPILLKPTGRRASQVVVNGRPWAVLDASAYQRAKAELWPVVVQALDDLRGRFDVVICEGAGSPAEINLLDSDIVNLRVARHAGFPALLVGDIDRGGVFAALHGTVDLLPPDLRMLVAGFVINKFRGDPTLLSAGLSQLEQRTKVPTLGVIPWLDGPALDPEDSLALAGLGTAGRGGGPAATGGAPAGLRSLDVAVVRFPRISNFTDLDPLRLEPAVQLRLAGWAADLGSPHLVILPGTKSTFADLEWLRRSGLAARIAELVARGRTTVLGICGGCQMLGETIRDEHGVEAHPPGELEGLRMLAHTTTFETAKTTRTVSSSIWGEPVSGYEIHHGRIDPSGLWYENGPVAGTTVHGLLDNDGFRRAFLAAAAARAGLEWDPGPPVCFAAAREARHDLVADAIEASLDVDAVVGMIGRGAP